METQQHESKKRRQTPRPYKFFASIRHRQIDAETQKPADPEFLVFEDKKAFREALTQPKYEGADVRVVRGYEMQAKKKSHISLA